MPGRASSCVALQDGTATEAVLKIRYEPAGALVEEAS